MHAALLHTDFSSAVELPTPRPYGPDIEMLADRVSLHIESLAPRGRVQCLDVGCGDTGIAETIAERLARTHWRRVGVRPAIPGPHGESSSSEDSSLDDTIPFGDGEFDVAVVSDMLRDDPERGAQLLSEAARVARYVLVKDRFERKSCARLTREAFIDLANRQGLVIMAFDSGLALHERSPVRKSPVQPGSNFVAVLCRSALQES